MKGGGGKRKKEIEGEEYLKEQKNRITVKIGR